MALETCCEGCSRDTWGSGSRLAIKSPGLGYLIHDARLPISSLIPALRLCSTAIARAGSCSLITFSKPDGRKPFFFPPHQCTHLCVTVLLRRMFRSKVDKCLPKANHFPQEERSCLHSSWRGRAKRRRLTHPALEDTQGPRGEEQVTWCRDGALPPHQLQGGAPLSRTSSSELHPIWRAEPTHP